MPKKTPKPTFEDEIERLEFIIDSMESGDTPLAELVCKFEEGSLLLKNCRKKLQEADLKIEQLNLETGKLDDFKKLESRD